MVRCDLEACLVVVYNTFCPTEQCSEDLKGKVAWQKRDLLGSELAKERQRSQSPGDPTLDSEMAKAVQESRVLKAVVVPLEEVHVCGRRLCITHNQYLLC